MSLASVNHKLFDTKEDSDVTFIVHNQELHAHQFVLIYRSPVFKAMIKGPMAPANQRHEIRDPRVAYRDFKNFLKFLYTDECEIDSDNAEVLLHLSDMYDVPFLFETCVNKLPQIFAAARVNQPYFYGSTVFKFAEMGLLYENKCDIVTKCLDEVPNYAKYAPLKYRRKNKTIWISAELALQFVKSCPRTDTFNEDIVFLRVFQWAQFQCDTRKLKINAVNVKKFMAPFETYIKYENMNAQILATSVHEYKLIPEERLLKCLCDHITGKKKPNIEHFSGSRQYAAPLCRGFFEQIN